MLKMLNVNKCEQKQVGRQTKGKKKKKQLKPIKNQYQKQYNQKAPNFQKLSHFNHDMHLSQKGLI
jgi:hypothetical protein